MKLSSYGRAITLTLSSETLYHAGIDNLKERMVVNVMAWEDLSSGSHVSMALLQVDMEGSSKLVGSTDQIAEAKAIFRRRVERIVEDYYGRLFSWPGDGGSFMFQVLTSKDYSNIVLAGIMMLNALESINTEIALQTNLRKAISIRISCDKGNLRYEPDSSNIHADFLNKFFKYERAISLTNNLTITERILTELPESLRDNFEFFKESAEVGAKLFKLVRGESQPAAVQLSRELQEKIIEELKLTVNSNESLTREVEVIRLISNVPRLEQLSAIEPDDKYEAVKKSLINEAAQHHKQFINDPHGIVIGEPVWNDDPVVFRYKPVDYVGLSLLREGGIPVPVLSASVVALCPVKRELYLHRRTDFSKTYPDCLHTVGGAYMPSGWYSGRNEIDLISTAQAEFREETGMNFLRTGATPMLLAKEVSTGFIQLVLLGVITTPEEVEARVDSWEGNVVVVGFDKLPGKILSDGKWVPTGLTHVIAWLGLGAPPLGPQERFGGLSAGELYARSLAMLKDWKPESGRHWRS